MTADRAPLAALLYDGDEDANRVLEVFARGLMDRGVRVFGLVQRRSPSQGCRATMLLSDLSGGQDFVISQDLGREAQGCCVDPQALAEAGTVLRQAMGEGRVDLLVVNKFGRMESEGQGFVAEIAAALVENVPVVTTLHRKYLEQWRDFTGGMAAELPPEGTALERWWAELCPPA